LVTFEWRTIFSIQRDLAVPLQNSWYFSFPLFDPPALRKRSVLHFHAGVFLEGMKDFPPRFFVFLPHTSHAKLKSLTDRYRKMPLIVKA